MFSHRYDHSSLKLKFQRNTFELHELQNQLKFNGLLKGKKVKKLMEVFLLFFFSFRKKITSRRTSAGRSTGTVENHLTGIRFFLSEMCSDAVLRLEML